MLVRGRIRRVLQFKHLHRCLPLPVDTTQRRKNSTLWLSRTKNTTENLLPTKISHWLPDDCREFSHICWLKTSSCGNHVFAWVCKTLNLWAPTIARRFKACLVGGELSVTDGLLDLCLSFYIYSWTQSVWTNSCITTGLWSVTLQWNRCLQTLKRVVSVSFSAVSNTFVIFANLSQLIAVL